MNKYLLFVFSCMMFWNINVLSMDEGHEATDSNQVNLASVIQEINEKMETIQSEVNEKSFFRKYAGSFIGLGIFSASVAGLYLFNNNDEKLNKACWFGMGGGAFLACSEFKNVRKVTSINKKNNQFLENINKKLIENDNYTLELKRSSGSE